MLDEFTWGREFVKINFELLEIYSSCIDSNDVILKQREWLERTEQEAKEGKPYILERNGADWKKNKEEDSDNSEEDNSFNDKESKAECWQQQRLEFAGGRGTGELPPSDDEYEEYYSDEDEYEYDSFGNIIEKKADGNVGQNALIQELDNLALCKPCKEDEYASKIFIDTRIR